MESIRTSLAEGTFASQMRLFLATYKPAGPR
jgi:hypothetical protein